MANVNRVNGFRPVRYLSAAPYNGAATRYWVGTGDSTALFVGDLVKISGTNNTANGIRGVTQAAPGDAACGAVVGFQVNVNDLDVPLNRAAATEMYVWVADDPNLLFVAQEDGATDPLEMADAGLNVNFVVGAGSTVTGASGMQIDSNTETTTATMTLKLIEPLQSPSNELVAAGQSYTQWVVKINNHQLGSSTGTEGV